MYIIFLIAHYYQSRMCIVKQLSWLRFDVHTILFLLEAL